MPDPTAATPALPSDARTNFFSALQQDAVDHQHPARAAITPACRMAEPEAVRQLLKMIERQDDRQEKTRALAYRLVAAVRSQRTQGSGVDALMHEFSLSSQEGVALMCLAEALLRIPDHATADRLIADKISRGNWQDHLGGSSSLFVNATAWGLLVSGKLVATSSERGLSAALGRLIAKGGEPLIRQAMHVAMRLLGNKFVTGQTIEQALLNSRKNEARGYAYSYDMLGEAALTDADAARYYGAYEQAMHAIGAASNGRGILQEPGISVKLSALHPRYSRAQRHLVMTELLPRLKQLVLLAKQYDIGINIDAEEADRLELSLDLLEALAFDGDLAGFDGIGFVVQAYQKRCPYVIDYLIDLARRSQRKFMVRLVKGAYWDAEIKRAQVDGLPGYPVYTRKVYTDLSYLACAQKLLRAADLLYPQFATHNAQTVAAIVATATDYGVDNYEFQCLHGMGETLYDQVVGADQLGRLCRIYAPVGPHETLLAYLVRRLLENGANSSFVNQIVDEHIALDDLVADPVALAARLDGAPHPGIPLPAQLFGTERINSAGLDLNDDSQLCQLRDVLNDYGDATWQAAPLLGDAVTSATTAQAIINPADHRDQPGWVTPANDTDVDTALRCAAAYAEQWQATPAAQRAAHLIDASHLLEAHRLELIAIAMREAGKSLSNAVAEVREAVDFLRYYARQITTAENTGNDTLPQAWGPVVCISPWNFPLAIFVGQISAAIAAGNVVLAKPAEQTPLIAWRAVQLLHAAGIPRAALQFLPGDGETVGAHLCQDARTRGVVFTGSTEVAHIINRTLCARMAREGSEIVLIAETGGQNALVADSSALAEQVVQDAVMSAFDSAGQRCSALRVLCLQDDIADKTIAMLKGAMQRLQVGPTGSLATDIGPVIDAQAQQDLLAYIDQARKTARDFYQIKLDSTCERGSFVAPTMLEIGSIAQLRREVFGPVLHVIRYQRKQLGQLIDDLNATGYGLTFGVHSRIDETIEFVTERAHVGNVYVNRNIVGAVVGVQPFGGEGKSGTGPKAGGPLYLWRLQKNRSAPATLLANPDLHGVIASGSGGMLAAQTTAAARALAAFEQWSMRTGHASLASQIARYAVLSLNGTVLSLPGPTGESNTLRFKPRGEILCCADSVDALLNQIAATLVTGNTALIGQAAAKLLPPELAAILHGQVRIAADASLTDMPVAGVLADSHHAHALRQACAEREGAIIPVIAMPTDAPWPIWRLIAEQAVCVNTTASGGNASLMAMAA